MGKVDCSINKVLAVCRHEGLNSDSHTFFKSPMWWCMSVILSLGRRQGQKDPWNLLASQSN